MTDIVTSSLQQDLIELIGVAHVRSGAPLDEVDGVMPSVVAEPANEQEVAAVLVWCNDRGLAVCPRGGGTKLGWGNPPRALDVLLSLALLDNLVEHAHGDMTATVQAGMRFGALQAALAQNGQMLALDVEHPERATIGGVIAANDSGALRVRYGGVRDQIIGITIVRPDGVTAHGGGRVVKNVAGYDLPKLFTGSLGSLGIITQATFRLYPLPAETRMLAMEVDSTEMARRLLLEMLHSTLMPTGLWVHRDVLGSVTVTAQFSGIPESVESQLQTAESILLGQRGFRPSPAVNSPPRQLEAPGTGGTPFVPGVVLKISVLPTEIPTAIARAIEIGDSNGWETDTLIHAHGLGRITWNTAGNEVGLVEAVESFRAALAPCGGSAVVLQAPLSVKRQLDVWGPATDALPLMRRVKAELDPRSTLNAGRMIGGL